MLICRTPKFRSTHLTAFSTDDVRGSLLSSTLLSSTVTFNVSSKILFQNDERTFHSSHRKRFANNVKCISICQDFKGFVLNPVLPGQHRHASHTTTGKATAVSLCCVTICQAFTPNRSGRVSVEERRYIPLL